MRKAEFAVPSDVMVDFVNEMTERELDNTIVGTSEDDEILVEVLYEKDETKVIDELEAILENLR